MTILEQFEDLIADRMKPHVIDVVGFERGSIAVRLLSDRQVSEAKIAAFQHIDEQCKESKVRLLDLVEVDVEAFDRERVVQLIHRAFVDADSLDPDDFDGAKEAFRPATIREMDSLIVDEFYETYLAYQATKAPAVELKPEDLAELVKQLREPGNEAALAVLNETALRQLVMAMAKAA